MVQWEADRKTLTCCQKEPGAMRPTARNNRVVPVALLAAMILLSREAPAGGIDVAPMGDDLHAATDGEWVQSPRGGAGEASFFRRLDLGP
jgi:hypothetical protein